MKNIAEAAIEMLEAGVSFAQATILTSSGSTPRGAGSMMLVKPDQTIIGTVGGGIMEGSIQKAAAKVISEKKALIMDFVLDGKDAAAVGMICGGAAKILIDYIDMENEDNLDYYKTLMRTVNSGKRAWIATILPESGNLFLRNQCIIRSDGTLVGSHGFYPEVTAKLKTSQNQYDVFALSENWQIYLQPIGTNGIVYVFGAGHCGEKLVPLLHTVGFGTVIIDDRAEFANETRFPDADEILVPKSMDVPFENIFFNRECYIVIVTRGHVHDELVLRNALGTGAGYIGMIGSRVKRETIYQHMLADGYTKKDIERVYSPIGLSIGAETPEEIAVSITSQLIQVRAALKQESE